MKIVLVPVAALGIAVAALCAAPSGAQSPADKTWSLQQGRGITAEPANRPSLKLEGQRLSGSTGCNSFTATISETGERVKIENVSLTRKLCATVQNENERAFVNALGQTQYLTREPQRITFLSDKHEPLLVWTSGEPEKEGNRDRRLKLPSVAEGEKVTAATGEAQDEPAKQRHHPKLAHHKHGRKHAHRHQHGHRHGHGHGRRHVHGQRYAHVRGHRYAHRHRHAHRHYGRTHWGCPGLW